jgi:hypothetical protein
MNITVPTSAAVSTALILAGCGFSDTEQKYLNAMQNPCQHSEIFSNPCRGPRNCRPSLDRGRGCG